MDIVRLENILDAFVDIRVAVIGDFFLDKILQIDPQLNEPSVETDLTAYQITQKILEPGAAGTITNNLSHLKVGKIYAVGAVGVDGEGFELANRFKELLIDDSYLIRNQDWFTPTYIKPFLKFENKLEEINRLDIKNRKKLPTEIEERIIENIYHVSTDVDAIIILDQLGEERTGIVTARVKEALSDIAGTKPEIIMFADSRARPSVFKNIMVKCNQFEAINSVYPDYTGEYDKRTIARCAEKIREITGKNVYITCGDKGITALDDTVCQLIPAVKVEGDIDICGAGDAATAGLVGALCAGADMFEAAIVGNLAASVTVRQIGKTGVATKVDIIKAWQQYTKKTSE
jgi:bifunctional ADP-heptose synthase (sugar kinase/adenylyltransferase)